MRRWLLYGVMLGLWPALAEAQSAAAPLPRIDVRALFKTPLPALTDGATRFSAPAASGPLVFLFLAPECPLCKNYSLTLNQLYQKYGAQAHFFGIIPGKTDAPGEVDAFIKKYHILFPLYRDPQLSVSKRLHAGVTPQAVVLDARGREIYSGLIDDWAASLGVQRARVTHHYLQDALDAESQGRAPSPDRTTPVGCLINAF